MSSVVGNSPKASPAGTMILQRYSSRRGRNPLTIIMLCCRIGRWNLASQLIKMRLMHYLVLSAYLPFHDAFTGPPFARESQSGIFELREMKRPLIDQIASTLFRLENDRVQASSVVDDKGRVGEPMEWSEGASVANRFSAIVASNPVGYRFKQWIADIIAGDYDEEATKTMIQNFISSNDIAMFSFTTCPFCRRAKDALDERGISYAVLELDEFLGNQGNEIRAQLGKLTKRTSVPSIFVKSQCIGGCNDGPGLLPLMESGDFDTMLTQQ